MFIVYHKDTTIILGNRYGYDTEMGAKVARAAQAKKEGVNKEDYLVTDWLHFHEKIEKTVTRVSAIDPSITFEEPINTPYYCSPSSETYWSM